MHKGVYVCAGAPVTLHTHVAAALLTLPDGTAASHITALQLSGVHLGPRTPLHFTSPHARQVRRPGVCVHRRTKMPGAADGRVSAERAFVDSAAMLGLVGAVAAGDWLLHTHLTDLERLGEEVTASSGVHGVGAARAALAFVRPRVESPRETLLRLLLVLAGLPEPLTNVEVTRDGAFIARADLVYDRYRVIVEYDGRQHAEDVQQWNRDLDRHDQLAEAGWQVVRVTARRLRDPRAVVQRVYAQLVAGGYRGPAPRFDSSWVRLFEG